MACKKGAQKGRQRKDAAERKQRVVAVKSQQQQARKRGDRKKPQRPAQKPAGDQKG